MTTPLMQPAEQVGHLRVAMLSLPERAEAVLEFFFSTTGANQFSATDEDDAQAGVFDAETPASRAHWEAFRQRTGRPGIALSAQATDWPGTVWVRKPVTPAAMSQAAVRVAELMRQAEAGIRVVADSPTEVAQVANLSATVGTLKSSSRVVIALPVSAPNPTPAAAPLSPDRPDSPNTPDTPDTPVASLAPVEPAPPETTVQPDQTVTPVVPADASRQAIDTKPVSPPQPATPRQGWLRRLLMRWLGWGAAPERLSRSVETEPDPLHERSADTVAIASAEVHPEPVTEGSAQPPQHDGPALDPIASGSEDLAPGAAAQAPPTSPDVPPQTAPSRLLRAVPPEELALEAAFCGLRDDLPWAAFATDPSLRYAAETSLMDAVREARLIGRKWPAPTQLEQDAVRLVIDGGRNLLHVEPDQEALTGLLKVALARRPKTRTFSHAESKAWQERAQHFGACLPLQHTLWSLSLQASQGRLPIGVDPAQTVYLKHWPNLTRLPRTPHAMRIATLWATRGASLIDTVETLNIPQRHVVAFYNAVRAIDLITDDGSQILRAQRKATRNSKVLSRLMGWLSR